MSWIFSFIILLSVCHCSYTKKSSDESYSEEKLDTNVEPYKQKKSSVEKNLKYIEKKQSPKADLRFKIQESRYEDKPSKEKYKESPYIDQNKNTPPKRAQESIEYKEKEKVWRFELDLPELLRTLKKYTGVAISDAMPKKTKYNESPQSSRDKLLRTSEDAGIFRQKIRVEMKPPNVASLMGFVQDLFSSGLGTRRDYFPNRFVEESPGVIKSQAEPYPTYQEAGQLQALLEIKKKRQQKEEQEKKEREEEANRDLN